MDLLKTENLVELHEKLNEFATHYKNLGGQEAHRLIKKELVDSQKGMVRDGSEQGQLIDQGYDLAIKQVLNLLHKNFVP